MGQEERKRKKRKPEGNRIHEVEEDRNLYETGGNRWRQEVERDKSLVETLSERRTHDEIGDGTRQQII